MLGLGVEHFLFGGLKDAVHDNCVEILKEGDSGLRTKEKAEADKKAEKKVKKSKSNAATPGANEGVKTDGTE